MMQWEGTRTSRSCMPLPVLGLGCWAHSAAPGYPAGSETTISHPPVSEEVVNKGLLMNCMSGWPSTLHYLLQFKYMWEALKIIDWICLNKADFFFLLWWHRSPFTFCTTQMLNLSVWLHRTSVCDLFDGDGRPPVFVLLQDGQTHGTRRVDVWVEYGWLKLAWV